MWTETGASHCSLRTLLASVDEIFDRGATLKPKTMDVFRENSRVQMNYPKAILHVL